MHVYGTGMCEKILEISLFFCHFGQEHMGSEIMLAELGPCCYVYPVHSELSGLDSHSEESGVYIDSCINTELKFCLTGRKYIWDLVKPVMMPIQLVHERKEIYAAL